MSLLAQAAAATAVLAACAAAIFALRAARLAGRIEASLLGQRPEKL